MNTKPPMVSQKIIELTSSAAETSSDNNV